MAVWAGVFINNNNNIGVTFRETPTFRVSPEHIIPTNIAEYVSIRKKIIIIIAMCVWDCNNDDKEHRMENPKFHYTDPRKTTLSHAMG